MKKFLILILIIKFFVFSEEKRWERDKNGNIKIYPFSVPNELKNKWEEEWENEFWERANHIIRKTARKGNYGNTYFENEKRSYGWAMLSILGGYEEEGLKFLQEEDAQANTWNKHTKGIDFFPCFTLKHQMRKYFFFGDYLNPEYKKRMYEGAKIWTEKDPLYRPHHAFDPLIAAKGEENWTPLANNSWVDIRDTDNLKLMRDCAVYLFAEETQNEETKNIYKRKLEEFIFSVYKYGMGEWDSENYLGHSFVPLLCLYDFAKDLYVKKLAKYALDWMSISASIKYWRGACNGPTKRDYNHPYIFGGSLANIFWLYFGDTPFMKEDEFESDEIHVITSGYRPPSVSVEIARRKFKKPIEIISAKPPYHVWKLKEKVKPEYYEVTYITEKYQIGVLSRGTQNPDVNGFKILIKSEKDGVNFLLAGPIKDPFYICSPMYKEGLLKGESFIAPYHNSLIYITKDSDIPYIWAIPYNSNTVIDRNILFLNYEKLNFAFLPINLFIEGINDELTRKIHERRKWKNLKIVSSKIIDISKVYGFAMEISDREEDFESFRNRIIEKNKILFTKEGILFLNSNDKKIELRYDPEYKVYRDGKIFEIEQSKWVYFCDSDELKIKQEWGGKKIQVFTRNYIFHSEIN